MVPPRLISEGPQYKAQTTQDVPGTMPPHGMQPTLEYAEGADPLGSLPAGPRLPGALCGWNYGAVIVSFTADDVDDE
jgi:hypothetical protein